MATRFFCDRCDRHIDDEVKVHKLKVPALLGNHKDYELCSYCVNAVHEFLRPQMKCAAAEPVYTIIPSPIAIPDPVPDPAVEVTETPDDDVPF